MERDQIFYKVRTIIANVIEEDEDDISIDCSLVDDLGIESVDLVDISAKIEEAFDIEIADGELWNLTSFFTADGMMKNERITVRGAEALQKCFGQDFQEIKPGTCLVDIFSSIKVSFIVDFLSNKLNQDHAIESGG
jgi:acyl carrier protein